MYTFYSQTEKFRGQSDGPGIHPSVNILVSTLFLESSNSLTTKKQTTRFSSANIKKI